MGRKFKLLKAVEKEQEEILIKCTKQVQSRQGKLLEMLPNKPLDKIKSLFELVLYRYDHTHELLSKKQQEEVGYLITNYFKSFLEYDNKLKEYELHAMRESLVINNLYSYYGKVCVDIQNHQTTMSKLYAQRQ